MKNSNLFIALALALVLGACSSATNLTGAKTQKAGEFEMYAGGSYSKNLVRNSTDGTTKTAGFDFAGRYGVTDVDEVGFGYRNAGQITFDYKRNLMSDSQSALSVGAGIGYLSVEVGSTSTSYMDFAVPVYYDYKLSGETTLLFSAKYLLSRISSDSASASANSLGAAAGARFGEDSGLHAEFGFLFPLGQEDGTTAWQGSLGFFF